MSKISVPVYLDRISIGDNTRVKLRRWMFAIFFSSNFAPIAKVKRPDTTNTEGDVRPRRRKPFPLMFSWSLRLKSVLQRIYSLPFNSWRPNKLASIKFYQPSAGMSRLYYYLFFVLMNAEVWEGREMPSRSLWLLSLEKAGDRASLSGIGVQFNKKWHTWSSPLTCLYIFLTV